MHHIKGEKEDVATLIVLINTWGFENNGVCKTCTSVKYLGEILDIHKTSHLSIASFLALRELRV